MDPMKLGRTTGDILYKTGSTKGFPSSEFNVRQLRTGEFSGDEGSGEDEVVGSDSEPQVPLKRKRK